MRNVVVTDPPRADAGDAETLGGFGTATVHEALGRVGYLGPEFRPAFDKLCRDAAWREFDVVMAWSVDRLGRSLQDLVGFLSELHALKIDLFLRQQGLDASGGERGLEPA